jgi:group I intron endonuclease
VFIYVITNSVTGKVYIGQHKGHNLKKYLQTKLSDAMKRRGGQSLLFNSMRKHPKEVWSIKPLIEGIETKEALDRWEKIYIALFDTRNHEVGYNICRGGGGALGWAPSNETKAKISASNTGKHRERLLSLENQALRIAAWEQSLELHGGTFHTPDTLEKLKVVRALQDEPTRLKAFRNWESEHGDVRRARAAATHKGTKHTMTPEGSLAISEAFKKSSAIRWSTHSIVGQVFERLTVESEAGRNKRGLIQWNCRCVCGNSTIATTTLLRTGHKKSCGCLARESSITNLQRIR